MKLLNKFIFDNSRWWWGKLSASTLIGGLAFGLGALKATDGFVKAHTLDFAAAGCVIGFIAGFVLMLNDFRQGSNVDYSTHPPPYPVIKAKKTMWPVVFGLMGLGLMTVILYCVWIVWRLTTR